MGWGVFLQEQSLGDEPGVQGSDREHPQLAVTAAIRGLPRECTCRAALGALEKGAGCVHKVGGLGALAHLGFTGLLGKWSEGGQGPAAH